MVHAVYVRSISLYPGSHPCTCLGSRGSLPQLRPISFGSFPAALTLPWATRLALSLPSQPPFLEELFIFTVSLLADSSLSLSGLAPRCHPRDFPHQGHRGLRDTDTTQSLSHLISRPRSRWLTASPFLTHFSGLGVKGMPLQDASCYPLQEPLLGSSGGSSFYIHV